MLDIGPVDTGCGFTIESGASHTSVLGVIFILWGAHAPPFVLTHDHFPPVLSHPFAQGEYMRLSMGTSSGIDHAGHLTGLLFGATTMACVRLVSQSGGGGSSYSSRR